MSNAKVNGQGSNVSLEPGDWFSYKLSIDLPGIPSDQPKMLKIELLTNDPVIGKIVTHISQNLSKNPIQEIHHSHLQLEK